MKKARPAFLALAGLLTFAVGLAPDDAAAQERRHRRPPRGQAEQVQPRATPMLAVVGLREQRITVYDSTGARMLESPVSSGADGYETPPGIFSVVQKELEHHSNLYDDASMPFMQRITWTGIALHAGVLPGYAASHGCVRLPHDFAERLYDMTNLGLRVVVARAGMAPALTAEPAMFKRHAPAAEATSPAALEARARQLAAAAEDAGRRSREARVASGRAKSAAQPAERAMDRAEAALAKAEADLRNADKLLATALPPKRLADAEKAKAAASARIEASRTQLDKVRRDAEAKLAAARQAEQAATEAAATHAEAVHAAETAKQDTAPVSVFISRKTQRIYVRKAFHPLWEGPVAIRDAGQPIGTFVFTANEPAAGDPRLRWSVLSLYPNPTAIEPPQPRAKGSRKAAPHTELPLTDTAAATAALARLEVPPAMAARIAETVLPGSSLIISDEPPSIETGKDTDFVVVMSGEPKGGLAIREHAKPDRFLADDERETQRNRRAGSGGGVFGFWFD